MKSYIVDTERFEVTKSYNDISFARFDMSDNYGWHPNERYKLFYEDELQDYWMLRTKESGITYEGLGISENMLFDMFDYWIKESR